MLGLVISLGERLWLENTFEVAVDRIGWPQNEEERAHEHVSDLCMNGEEQI